MPRGLAEDDVISFVNNLMEQSRRGQEVRNHLASLYDLAERMVAEAEGALILADSKEQAHVKASLLIKKARRHASRGMAKSRKDADRIIAKAHQEAKDNLGAFGKKVASTDSWVQQGGESQEQLRKAKDWRPQETWRMLVSFRDLVEQLDHTRRDS